MRVKMEVQREVIPKGGIGPLLSYLRSYLNKQKPRLFQISVLI